MDLLGLRLNATKEDEMNATAKDKDKTVGKDEDEFVLPSSNAEEEELELNQQQDDEVRKHSLRNSVIGCRFLLAAYIWLRIVIEPTSTWNLFKWYHPIAGIPTSAIIVIWKYLEFQYYRKYSPKGRLCRIRLYLGPLFSFLCSLLLFAGGLGEDSDLSGFWILGYFCLVGINLLEGAIASVQACTRICCEDGIKNFLGNTAPPILQALGFFFFGFLANDVNSRTLVALSGLFFVWEGIVLVGFDKLEMLVSCHAFFKVFTAFSFWGTSGTYNMYVREGCLDCGIFVPISILLSCFAFDAQRIVASASSRTIKVMAVTLVCILPVAYTIATSEVFFETSNNESYLLLAVSSLLLLLSFGTWLRTSWRRAGEPDCKTAMKAICVTVESMAKLLWSCIKCTYMDDKKKRRPSIDSVDDTDEATLKDSIFVPYGDFFNFVACALLFVLSIKVNAVPEEDLSDESVSILMVFSAAVGISYFMHAICWIKVQFFLSENKDAHPAPKYNLAEDTYTLMMYAQNFSATWFLSMAVFVVQSVLIGMIIFAQWGQHNKADVFLDVPLNVTLTTRIGQVAGMLIILFYQNDYWVASTLLEIRFLGKAIKIKDIKGDGEKKGLLRGFLMSESSRDIEANRIMNSSRRLAILFPSTIRFFQSVGVLVASTVLILQSENIIDLVKDYTAVFFISEIDDVVFQLASQGYLGGLLKKDAEDAKDTCVPDVKEHPFRTFGFLTMFSLMFTSWIFVTNNQRFGFFFKQAHEECFEKVGWKRIESLALDYQNGECNTGLNYAECNFDGGDCLPQNLVREMSVTKTHPDCLVTWKSYIGE